MEKRARKKKNRAKNDYAAFLPQNTMSSLSFIHAGLGRLATTASLKIPIFYSNFFVTATQVMAAEGDMEAAGSPELLHTDPDTTEDEDDDGDAVMLTRVESLPAATSGHVAAGRTGTDSATSAGTAAAKPAARPSARPSVELIGTQQLGSAFGALMQPLQRRTSVPSAKRPPSPDSAEVQKSATESRLSHLARSGSYQGQPLEFRTKSFSRPACSFMDEIFFFNGLAKLAGRVAEQSWVERHKPKSTVRKLMIAARLPCVVDDMCASSCFLPLLPQRHRRSWSPTKRRLKSCAKLWSTSYRTAQSSRACFF